MQAPDDFDPEIGVAETLQDGLRRIVAPNPSPMTYRGTNTYLIGESDLAVIDPGPDDARHLQAILQAVQPGQQISHILVTHAHLDHSPLARALSHRIGAPVYAFGDAQAGRSAVMAALAQQGLAGGGEGVDIGFVPDHTLADAENVQGAGWQVTAYWTPGHFGNHLCFGFEDVVLTGDLVMGWASSLVSPPDGDLTDFMRSCDQLSQVPAKRFYPGHGKAVQDPQERLHWLVSHRRQREAQILQALAENADTATGLARRIYTETPVSLLPAAARNVFAHLIDLAGKKRVAPERDLAETAKFTLL